MNIISLYGKNLTSVNFLLFSNQNELIDTLSGIQNIINDNFWEAVIPGTVDEGHYTIIAESDSEVIGGEYIYWTGTEIINQQKELSEIHKIHGLVPTIPLEVSSSQRTAGNDIAQTVIVNSNITTVTRV